MKRILRVCVVLVFLATACTSGPPAGSGRDVPTPNQSEGQGGTQLRSLADRLQADLTIEGQPDWMTVGYGSVWVTVDEKAAVARIDPATNEVAAMIEVGGHPCDGLSAVFGAIWVPSCTDQTLYRISPGAENVEAAIPIPVFQAVSGAGPFGGLAAGAGAVWMVTEGGKGTFDALARIDPRTNTITDTIPLGHLGGGVAVGEGAVWVTAPEDGMLLRVDPESREVAEEVTGLAQPTWVAVGEGGVWVQSGTWGDHQEGDGSVVRVDPQTNEIVTRIRVDDSPGQAAIVTVGGGSVWARSQFTLLAKIAPESNLVVERYEDQKGLGDIEIGFGSVWLSDFGFNKVWRLPLDTG